MLRTPRKDYRDDRFPARDTLVEGRGEEYLWSKGVGA